MADPTVIQCADACTITVQHVITIPGVTDLTIEQASMVGGAIVLVWAVGWGYRRLTRQVQSGASNLESE